MIQIVYYTKSDLNIVVMPQRYTIFRRAEIYNGQKEDFRKDRRLLHFCNYRRKIFVIFVVIR